MRLNIENLSFSYPANPQKILDNFNLTVNHGEIVAVLGRSGSGKSTLLRIIAGLEENAQGTVTVGENIFQSASAFTPTEKRKIGFVFQDYVLFPFMTVQQNIAFGGKRSKGLDINTLMALTRLEGLQQRYPHQLSGGQQQRVALARTLASDPSLLLMDEPFSNLDATLVHEMRAEIRSILKEKRVTTLFVTHNPEDAHAIADRMIYVDA